jgi:GDPmannose 4,6-dehydratase
LTGKKAFITGITGQDGSYLAELLLAKGYEVHGLVRRASTMNRGRIEHLLEKHDDRIFLHYGDVTDPVCILDSIGRTRPDEVYNLAAQSHVRVSFEMPEFTLSATGNAVLHVLEAVRRADHPIRFYQASSSEMFGSVREIPQTEATPFYPRSPYGAAKVLAHWLTVNYRESYKLHASSGILFNHEGPRRGENFVTRKITLGIAKIVAGKEKTIGLGNLSAKRDWGYAAEYVEAMWLMLQQPEPDDYVVATGETHSVQEFLDEACHLVNLDPVKVVRTETRHYRPAEVDLLVGDASKARKKLGWKPRTTFKDLVRIMLTADLEAHGISLETGGAAERRS